MIRYDRQFLLGRRQHGASPPTDLPDIPGITSFFTGESEPELTTQQQVMHPKERMFRQIQMNELTTQQVMGSPVASSSTGTDSTEGKYSI